MECLKLNTLEYLSYRKPNFEGNEGKLFIRNNQVHKIYKKIWQYDSRKIILLNERQKYIKNTTMPLGIISLDDIFIGVILKLFQNHIPLSKLNSSLIIDILRQIKVNLQELTSNYIYPTDLDDENILISKTGKVEFIDIDGLDTIVSSSFNKKHLKTVLILYRNIILSLLYPGYDAIDYYSQGNQYLSELGIRNSFIYELSSPDLSYESLQDFIDYTVKDKKIK